MAFHIDEHKITHTFETMTSQQAQHILEHECYGRQRKMDTHYVQEYAAIMRRGEFRPATEIAFGRLGGRRFLLNGQHTLTAIRLFGEPLRLSVLTYEVEEEWMLHALYLTYDRNRLRSFDQLYDAYNFGPRFNLNKIQTKRLGAAMPLLITGFQAVDTVRLRYRMLLHSGVIRLALMEDFIEEMAWYNDLIHGSPQEMSGGLRRAGVIALALVTLRHTGEDAADFWRNVASDDRLAADDPQKICHYFLRETPASTYPQHVYVRHIATTWNAAFHQHSLRRIATVDDKQPLLLEGTPHTVEQVLHYVSTAGDIWSQPHAWDDER